MNWGAPFIVVFIALLLASAAELSAGAAAAANSTAVYGFYALVVGVVLQVTSYVKYGETSSASPASAPQAAAVRTPARSLRRMKAVAVTAVCFILLAALVAGYPALVRQKSPSLSGCNGPTDDGTVYIDTNATVSIEVCGQVLLVEAGTGGGLTYHYHAGVVNFTAPSSANGSAFEFWYPSIGPNPQPVEDRTMDLNLPAGLNAQSSLIEVYYTAPPIPAASTTTASTTIASVSSSTMTSFASSSSSATSSSISSSTSSTTSTTSNSTSISVTSAFCMGDDGSVFVSTNVNVTVPINICGKPTQVPGGEGGGIDFSYQTGYVTLIAPATVAGYTFEFWYVGLPSQVEQTMNTQVTIYLPAGYAPTISIVVAYYGV